MLLGLVVKNGIILTGLYDRLRAERDITCARRCGKRVVSVASHLDDDTLHHFGLAPLAIVSEPVRSYSAAGYAVIGGFDCVNFYYFAGGATLACNWKVWLRGTFCRDGILQEGSGNMSSNKISQGLFGIFSGAIFSAGGFSRSADTFGQSLAQPSTSTSPTLERNS